MITVIGPHHNARIVISASTGTLNSSVELGYSLVDKHVKGNLEQGEILMIFLRLFKAQIILYLVFSLVVGGLISIENGLLRGVFFTMFVFGLGVFTSYYNYRKIFSKYGKKDFK
jgi:hypothetical protein